MTTTNDPLVGTTYDGRYRVERRVGTGGMANVYLAEDETLGRRVAIKLLHQRYAEDTQFVERFLREASAAARLNHPNIVQVYDRGQSDGSYYIAMEYIDGMTLKDLIRRRGALSEQEVLAYGRQALHALRFAHRNGIVHRDIKPHNMMVDTDGRLKIADFGIARAGTDTGLTEAGSIVGTAQYLSPEQARGMEVAASSDLYSLGVVMFEMATGRVPFDGDSPVNVALKHVNDPVPHPSQLKRDLSPAIESIILKAMEKDPERRYGSADEMLADLDLARDGGTTSAMTQVLGTTGTATQVLGGAPITPITPADTPPYRRAMPPEPDWPQDDYEDERERPDRRRLWLILGILLLVALLAAAAWYLLGTSRVVVPDVTGQRLAAARAAVIQDGFEVGDEEQEFSSDEPRGVVIEQSPEGGGRAKEGSSVDLVISKGAEPVAVPNVVGKARAAAVAQLRKADFETVKVNTAPSDSVNRGVVISQNPEGNQRVAPGTDVTIVVSAGPDSVDVPSVIGKSEDDARRELKGAGFDVDSQSADSSAAPGEVFAQFPEGGSLEQGETVRITVGSGKNDVPGVVSSTPEDARATLEGDGFKVDEDEVEDPTMAPGDPPIVSAQDPDKGTVRTLGSTVTITIATAPPKPKPEPEPQPEPDPPPDPAPVEPAPGLNDPANGAPGAGNGNGNGNAGQPAPVG